MAAHMFNSGKNGVSAHEIHRTLGVTYKTAWFMMHRLREAMNELNPSAMGGEGRSVQADETYYGNSSKRAKGYRKGHSHKASVVALVEPKGRARLFHLNRATQHRCRRVARPLRRRAGKGASRTHRARHDPGGGRRHDFAGWGGQVWRPCRRHGFDARHRRCVGGAAQWRLRARLWWRKA